MTSWRIITEIVKRAMKSSGPRAAAELTIGERSLGTEPTESWDPIKLGIPRLRRSCCCCRYHWAAPHLARSDFSQSITVLFTRAPPSYAVLALRSLSPPQHPARGGGEGASGFVITFALRGAKLLEFSSKRNFIDFAPVRSSSAAREKSFVARRKAFEKSVTFSDAAFLPSIILTGNIDVIIPKAL